MPHHITQSQKLLKTNIFEAARPQYPTKCLILDIYKVPVRIKLFLRNVLLTGIGLTGNFFQVQQQETKSNSDSILQDTQLQNKNVSRKSPNFTWMQQKKDNPKAVVPAQPQKVTQKQSAPHRELHRENVVPEPRQVGRRSSTPCNNHRRGLNIR